LFFQWPNIENDVLLTTKIVFRPSIFYFENGIIHIFHNYFMQQLIEKRREKRAAELVKMDNEVIVKLENAAIERSRSVESAVLGKYNIWRKEVENENGDSSVRFMRDQIIMARVYVSIAKMKDMLELYQELQFRLKESQHALGDAITDSDLHHRLELGGIYLLFVCLYLNLLPS
jgi:hypothetical protein